MYIYIYIYIYICVCVSRESNCCLRMSGLGVCWGFNMFKGSRLKVINLSLFLKAWTKQSMGGRRIRRMWDPCLASFQGKTDGWNEYNELCVVRK